MRPTASHWMSIGIRESALGYSRHWPRVTPDCSLSVRGPRPSIVPNDVESGIAGCGVRSGGKDMTCPLLGAGRCYGCCLILRQSTHVPAAKTAARPEAANSSNIDGCRTHACQDYLAWHVQKVRYESATTGVGDVFQAAATKGIHRRRTMGRDDGILAK